MSSTCTTRIRAESGPLYSWTGRRFGCLMGTFALATRRCRRRVGVEEGDGGNLEPRNEEDRWSIVSSFCSINCKYCGIVETEEENCLT